MFAYRDSFTGTYANSLTGEEDELTLHTAAYEPETSYVGHFSWIYLFNNQVTKVQDRDIIASAQDQETYGIVPTNDGGGSLSAGEYSNLFDWLNDQKK